MCYIRISKIDTLLTVFFKNKGKLKAFSDGVIAFIITIMVLALKVPYEQSSFKVLLDVLPVFLSDVPSFIYVGIYWNNHHHLFVVVNKVNGAVLWANLHLLFWLSMVTFATTWMGDNHFAPSPMALYSFILLMCALAYSILANLLIKHHGKNSLIAKATASGLKGKLSVVYYVLATPSAFLSVWISGNITCFGCYGKANSR